MEVGLIPQCPNSYTHFTQEDIQIKSIIQYDNKIIYIKKIVQKQRKK